MMQNDNNNSELNLLIIWENGRTAEDAILNDIDKNFTICEIFDIEWSDDTFHSNMTRFYGQKLPAGSGKERHCGKGRFLLITFIDKNPIYQTQNTSKGPENVNINVFDKKQLYREWTGGGHKIHTTNGSHETGHDLMLLLGEDDAEYLNKFKNKPSKALEIVRISKDLEGVNGWRNFSQLFTVLNKCCKYVVMRNYDILPDAFTSEEHGDVDFLAENAKDFAYVMNATPHDSYFRPNAYDVTINGQKTPCDIRELDDGYYDSRWQSKILDRALLSDGKFYIPSQPDYIAMLVYHALIHKVEISPDYLTIFKENNILPQNMYAWLDQFLMGNKYNIEYPKDISVYFNYENSKQLITLINEPNIFIRIFRIIRQFWAVKLRRFMKQILRGNS